MLPNCKCSKQQLPSHGVNSACSCLRAHINPSTTQQVKVISAHLHFGLVQPPVVQPWGNGTFWNIVYDPLAAL
jgi:hypothetical protein